MARACPRAREHPDRGNRRNDEPHRKQIARQLASLPQGERVWGRDRNHRDKGRTNKRPR